MRPPGPVTPRPEGISRRVATAARDRHPGPLPEQRPTGWHRVVYDNPPPPVPARPEPPIPARPAAPARFDRTHLVDTPPQPPAPGAGAAGSHRPADARHRQVGRVLAAPPAGRNRRAVLVLAATVGAAAVAVLSAVVLLAGPSVPDETGPEVPATVAPIRPAGSPSGPAGQPDGPTAPSASTAGPGAESTAPLAADPTAQPPSAAGPDPAQVTTLTPGDPGFGWPSSAFGSAPPGS